MNVDQKMMIATAVRYGARSRVGRHCHNIVTLAPIQPAHERHADRIVRGLVVQRAGLVEALAAARAQPASPFTQEI